MSKEIMYSTWSHGAVYNTTVIKFNEQECNQILSEDLDDNNKRELIYAYYINYLDKNSLISPKTNYGDTNIILDRLLKIIDNYESKIIDKIINIVTLKEIECNISLLENMLLMTEEEKVKSRETIVPIMSEALGFENNKLGKYFKLIQNIRKVNPSSVHIKQKR